MTDFLEFLRATSYPGRGILVGRRCVYYFIMGAARTAATASLSRPRTASAPRRTTPPSSLTPASSSIIPVRTMGRDLVVTNGDQTDTICQHGDFRRGLMTREYEPDEPNWTPRISAIMHEDGSFELSILKQGWALSARVLLLRRLRRGQGLFSSAPIRGTETPCPPLRASRWR